MCASLYMYNGVTYMHEETGDEQRGMTSSTSAVSQRMKREAVSYLHGKNRTEKQERRINIEKEHLTQSLRSQLRS